MPKKKQRLARGEDNPHLGNRGKLGAMLGAVGVGGAANPVTPVGAEQMAEFGDETVKAGVEPVSATSVRQPIVPPTLQKPSFFQNLVTKFGAQQQFNQAQNALAMEQYRQALDDQAARERLGIGHQNALQLARMEEEAQLRKDLRLAGFDEDRQIRERRLQEEKELALRDDAQRRAEAERTRTNTLLGTTARNFPALTSGELTPFSSEFLGAQLATLPQLETSKKAGLGVEVAGQQLGVAQSPLGRQGIEADYLAGLAKQPLVNEQLQQQMDVVNAQKPFWGLKQLIPGSLYSGIPQNSTWKPLIENKGGMDLQGNITQPSVGFGAEVDSDGVPIVADSPAPALRDSSFRVSPAFLARTQGSQAAQPITAQPTQPLVLPTRAQAFTNTQTLLRQAAEQAALKRKKEQEALALLGVPTNRADAARIMQQFRRQPLVAQ